MRVFISWSGINSTSHRVAEVLQAWLCNIEGIAPVISTRDVVAGAQWVQHLTSALLSSDYCIACITKQSFKSCWIHYEAGMISARNGGGRVCPYLIDVQPDELTHSPLLTIHQAATSDKEGTRKLLDGLNHAIEPKHPERMLHALFDRLWPQLEAELRKAVPPELSSTAELLLKEALRGGGEICALESISGFVVLTGGHQLVERDRADSAGRWRNAIQQLREKDLLAPGENPNTLTLTEQGRLRAQQKQPGEVGDATV